MDLVYDIVISLSRGTIDCIHLIENCFVHWRRVFIMTYLYVNIRDILGLLLITGSLPMT